jgi:hypothetical protein
MGDHRRHSLSEGIMSDSRLPTEVELVYEVMPCNAMRTELEPSTASPHPCTYFRKWGTYHSYDYVTDGPPPTPGVVHEAKYMGRARLVPELLSGCRKAPILAVGINPNLPGWWSFNRGSVNPLFDDYKQYAHYFRYRAVNKLTLSPAQYAQYGGGPTDTPLSTFELKVDPDASGLRTILVELQPQRMYETYQALLSSFGDAMHWQGHALTVGEDLAYGNMVACPSARWTTVALPSDPEVPPMTPTERAGIVAECFHERGYFLRQLFQSLPSVVLIFSQNTGTAFIDELQHRFVVGNPQPGDSLEKLMKREVRMHYGDIADGTSLEARVIFAPHITGNPSEFASARQGVIDQLVEEGKAGRLRYNPLTKHLARGRGACVFCTMLQIGPCDYVGELQPLTDAPTLTADSALPLLLNEKRTQTALLSSALGPKGRVGAAWSATDDSREEASRNA